jgi:endothelin-converting enzyme/putative endopeptidase
MDARAILRDKGGTMNLGRRSLFALIAPAGAVTLAFACAPAAAPPSLPPPTTAMPTAPPQPPPPPPVAVAWDPNLKGPDEPSLDRSTPPCDDIYQFACGGWMKSTPIPDDEASWVRSFSVLHEENLKSLRTILERDAKGDTQGDAYGKELGDFWASCADEQAVEKRGTADLKIELDRIRAVHDAKSLVDEIAHLHTLGVGAAFGFDSEVDMKDATRMIAGLGQSGLGLPERDYYFRTDARSKDIRAAYEKHVAKTLELAGEPAAQATAEAAAVLKWETDMAGASMTNVELRDPQKVYHLLNLDGLKQIAPDVSWDGYLAGIGFPAITTINVGQPEFVKKIDALVKGASIHDWQVYLRWMLVRAESQYLPSKFVDEWFHFRQVLTGTKVLQPRWKRCVGFIDHAMGEALAQPFVKEHLGEDGKRAAEGMVAGIEASMKVDLDGLAWMDDTTRTKAEAKLAKIMNKIGYPAKWRSYEGLAVDRGAFMKNIGSAMLFEFRRQLAKVGKPVDKDEWDMSPPTVNAYYDPSMNQMVFPAGILEAPFYSKTQSPPLNFGGIGMVVGHELTHGFDDEGRQFDADGNLRDWWTPAVSAEFDRRAACVEHQYDAYIAVDDVHLKGKLTLGENIADLGGVKLSYATFERAEKERPVPTLGGFTPEQQFFLGFAQSWCANYRPEALRLLASTNPHSPPKYRVLGPLSNLPEFAAAFSCKDGSPMVRPKDKRCEVW